MNNLPLVSVIVPTYNRADLLGQTLDSLLSQTYGNWECLIIDDGSTDHTPELVEFYVAQDSRFCFRQRPHTNLKGANSCRNIGLEISKGKYIQWLDDDDLLSKEKLNKQVQQLESLEDPSFFSVCTWDFEWKGKERLLHTVFKDGQIISPETFFETITEKFTFIPPHAYLTPRYLLSKTGIWNPELTINQDAEFFTRVHLKSRALISIWDPSCYVLYRVHTSNRVSRKKKENLNSLFLSLRLMHAHLRFKNIKCTSYFKWKLVEILKISRGIEKDIVENHKYFYLENGISLKWYNPKNLRVTFYQIFYSIIKKYLAKFRN